MQTGLGEQLLQKMDEVLRGLDQAKAERVALQLVLTSCVANYVAERDDGRDWLALCHEAAIEGVRFSELEPEVQEMAGQYVAMFFNAVTEGTSTH